MKYLYWFCVAAVICGGVAVSVYFGAQSKTIPKISLSYFSDDKEISEAILKRLRLEIINSPHLALGVEPERAEHLKIWKTFLLQATQDPQTGYQKIFIDEDLFHFMSPEEKIEWGAAEQVSFKNDLENYSHRIQEALKSNARVVIIAPNIYTFQTLANSPAHLLKETLKTPITSISTTFIPVQDGDQEKMMFPCVTDSELDTTSTGALGCLIQQKSVMIRRKVKDNGKTIGLLDLSGESDYLLFINDRKSK